MHGTDKVGGLMVLDFGLVFSVVLSSLEIFLPTPLDPGTNIHNVASYFLEYYSTMSY